MCSPRLAFVLLTACLSSTVLSNECIFKTTASTLNAASDFAVSASTTTDSEDPQFVKFAPTSSRRLPNELFVDRPTTFFDDLFNRRHNSFSYMWASAQQEQRSGAALAHLISCAAERYPRSDDPNRHSLCVSTVVGDQTQESLDDRCNPELTTLLLIGDDNDSNRPNRTGTQTCWCDRMCLKPNAAFQDTSGASPRMRNIRSFVVLEENADSPTMEASEYENGERGNNRPGRNWFHENLVDAQPPTGKGVFPRSSNEQIAPGIILRSLRLVNVVDQISSADECPSVASGRADLQLRMWASVEEEMGSTLNAAVSSDLAETPATRSTIFLTISSALTAVLSFGWIGMATKLVAKIKSGGSGLKKLSLWSGLIVLTLLELAIENIPIYFLLRQEIAARNHLTTFAVEVIGVGNGLAVMPILDTSDEEFVEMMSGLVVIVVKNKGTSVAGIAVAAVFLSLVSISSIIIGVKQHHRWSDSAYGVVQNDRPTR